MRPALRLGLAAAAICCLVAACGGKSTARRDAIATYIVRVDAIEQHLQKPLLDVSKANRDFAGKKSGSAAARGELVRAQGTIQRLERRLRAVPAPPDAAHLKVLLLAFVARENAIAGEVVRLATFIPAYGAALAPLAPASVAVKRALALKTASIADKAAALDRYGAALAPVIAKLRTLRPRPASRPVWAQQIATLATDSFGNTSTATFTVFVHDSTPPVFTSVSPNLVIEATSAAGAVVNYLPATATDALAPPIFTYSKASGSTFAIGTTTVKVTAIDIVGNTTTKTFTITVRDTTPPVITSVSPNLTIEATSSSGAAVSYAPAVAFDAVGPVTYSYSKASGSTFAIGTTTVTVTATDAYCNVSAPRTFTVTVRDTTPPVITSVSPNLTIEATSAAGATVSYAAAAATDAVGPITITYSKASGTTFAIGTTTVAVTAKDAYGNPSTQTFTVTVRDTTPPAITAPNLTIEATGTGRRDRDLCADDHRCGRPGERHVHDLLRLALRDRHDERDDHGDRRLGQRLHEDLHRDRARHRLRRRSPRSAPTSPIDDTSSSGIVVNYGAATATDLVGPVTITYSKASGSTFAVGTTTVTVTATDAYGNKTTKTFTVTVIKH